MVRLWVFASWRMVEQEIAMFLGWFGLAPTQKLSDLSILSSSFAVFSM